MIKILCKKADKTELADWLLNSVNWMCLFGNDEVYDEEEYEIGQEAADFILENNLLPIRLIENGVAVETEDDLHIQKLINRLEEFVGSIFECHEDAQRTMATVAGLLLEEYPEAEFSSKCMLKQDDDVITEYVKTEDGIIYRKVDNGDWEKWGA